MPERETRYLIVNADDFGISPGVNRGILEAFDRGILTSTSVMVGRPAAEQAAALARERPGLSVGLHVESDGNGALAPGLDRQLRRFRELLGRTPTHIDSHHDIHRDPDVLPTFQEVARRLDIPLRGSSSVHLATRFYGQWGGDSHPEQVSVSSLIGMLEGEVPKGVTELICHPGYADPALSSSYRSERDEEVRTLCDPRIRAAVQRLQIRLIGFRDVPAILAGHQEPSTPFP
jgi:chitin disaccharide deacetylase